MFVLPKGFAEIHHDYVGLVVLVECIKEVMSELQLNLFQAMYVMKDKVHCLRRSYFQKLYVSLI